MCAVRSRLCKALLSGLGNDEVQVRVVGGGVGGITESDANLALASNAVLFGFNVRADAGARKIVEAEGLDMRYYNVIYDIIEDVKKALTGMLGSDLRENILGIAEVRDVFRSPKFGAIAGCMVTEGMVHRNRPIRVLRDDVVIFEGELESLRRFKRRRRRSACRHGVRHRREELQRRQGRRQDRSVREGRSRTQPLMASA